MEPELRAGEVLGGRYRLTTALGRGGQGRVWEAVDDRSGALCALKVFAPGADPRAETETLLRVQHPHLPRVFDVGEHQGAGYVVLERVAGSPLGPGQATKDLARVLGDVLGALDALHTAGLVHGDVKPANILVSQERAVLVDLALARPPGWTSQGSGTLAFAAPETLWGECSPASDLFSLGVTAVWVLTGRHPLVEDATDLNALAQALARGAAPRDSVLASLEPALRGEVARWLAADPHQRPSSARAALVSLMRNVEGGWPVAQRDAVAALRVPPAAVPPLVGRGEVLQRGAEVLRDALSGRGLGVVLTGPRGSGHHRAAEELLRAVRRLTLLRGSMVETAERPPELPQRPCLVLRDVGDGEELRDLASELERVRNYGPPGMQLALLATAPPLEAQELAPGLVALPLAALDETEVRALLDALTGTTVSPEAARRWHQWSGGLAARLVRAARRIEPAFVATAAESERALGGPEQELAPPRGLTEPALALLGALCVAQGAGERAFWLGPAAPRGTEQAVHELVRRGLLVCDARRLLATVRFDPETLPPSSRALVAARLQALPEHPSTSTLKARARMLVGDDAGALALLEEALQAPTTPPSERLWAAREGLRLAPGERDRRALELARWELALGHSEDALRTLAELPPTGPALVLRADALRRAGRPSEARGLAQAALAHEEPSTRAAACVVLSRDALDAGDLPRARALLEQAPSEQLPSSVLARLAETRSLVSLFGGAPEESLALAERALRELPLSEDPLASARLRSVAGMAAQARGELERACVLFDEAWALSSACGEQQAAATYATNLGGALFERGLLGEAGRWMERSIRAQARQGRMSDLARALCNLGSLTSFVGDARGAAALAAQAERAAEAAGDGLCSLLARVLQAELAGSAEARASALEDLATPAHLAGPLGAWLRSRCVLALARAGRLLEARARLGAVGIDAPAELQEAALEVALQDGAPQAELRALVQRLAGSAHGAPESRLRRLALEVRTYAALGSLPERRAARDRYQRALEGLARTLAEPLRPAFLAQHTLDTAVDSAALPAPQDAVQSEQRWRLMAELTRELNSEQRLRPLLQKVMAAVVALTGASRGLVLLRGPDGVLRVRAAYNLDASAGEELAFSRSVAERVAGTGEPLWTVDAQSDERMSTFDSVHAMRLRSVLAVPLAIHGEVVGTLYVDDRLRPRAFGEHALEVAAHFAEAAAVALHNARNAALLRRELRRSERLSRQLGRRLELASLELQAARHAESEGVRGSYDEILGRGPAMQRALRLLDRVAPSAMPVLLQGENGTGKELFARALHKNSPRAARPFVAENCGAIPETLLESVLFGHVRGAFTGAERNRPGLFEVADGGTLFLDEVGEMSAAMQAKLLRVLQDGTFRRVGETQDRKANVRVVAATHRDLPEMVRQGRFREDLYYRLAVMVLQVPPLRQRREDIPALVAGFVRKHAGRELGIEREALERLLEYSWPGNVRQLENEVLRACAMAGASITAEDLSPAVAGTQPVLPAPGSAQSEVALDTLLNEGLRLEQAVEKLERAMIERALRAHHGNQTHAAKALGMSRFGLQKKLQRLELDVPPARRGRPRRELTQ